MVFCPAAFVRIAYAPIGAADGKIVPGVMTSIFRYVTEDAPAAFTASYLNQARKELTKGSVIDITFSALSATPIRKLYQVTSVPATGDVVVALLTTT